MQTQRGFILFWIGKSSPRKGLIEREISKVIRSVIVITYNKRINYRSYNIPKKPGGAKNYALKFNPCFLPAFQPFRQ